MAATAMVLSTQKASAAVPTLPEPVAPSAECEWMGELHLYKNSTYTSSVPIPTALTNYEKYDYVSAPVEGQQCGLLWAGEWNQTQLYTKDARCTSELGDTYTEFIDVKQTGSGTGFYNTQIFDYPLDPVNDIFYATAYGTNGDTVSTGSWDYSNCFADRSDTWLNVFRPGMSNSDCYSSVATKTGWLVNPNAQASVGSCKFHTTTTGTTSSDNAMEISWRFKKVNCDPTVDSDNAGVSDCEEYDMKTNPMDPSDDVSQQAQELLDLVGTTGSECYGEVLQLAADQAGANQGIKNVFAAWNLTGVPGVTENSSAQQKMDAVRQYCQTN